jgi:hypothetical protein
MMNSTQNRPIEYFEFLTSKRETSQTRAAFALDKDSFPMSLTLNAKGNNIDWESNIEEAW